ncbi:MAG TPA: immunity 53 family protein [Candidatus Paceibacterota bacterium]|nr:immunity 53 family protein [Candidatus Paceibacterota bacterium]
MNHLHKLQEWYRSQCDGDWEHGYGVKITTLDNPGWSVSIDLVGTAVEEKNFEPVLYGVGKDAVEGSDEWLSCRVEEKTFEGRGGPQKLEEILELFLQWTKGPTSR